jgi:hypothetical protein
MSRFRDKMAVIPDVPIRLRTANGTSELAEYIEPSPSRPPLGLVGVGASYGGNTGSADGALMSLLPRLLRLLKVPAIRRSARAEQVAFLAALTTMSRTLSTMAATAQTEPDYVQHNDPDEWAALLRLHSRALTAYVAAPHRSDATVDAQDALRWIAAHLPHLIHDAGE